MNRMFFANLKDLNFMLFVLLSCWIGWSEARRNVLEKTGEADSEESEKRCYESSI